MVLRGRLRFSMGSPHPQVNPQCSILVKRSRASPLGKIGQDYEHDGTPALTRSHKRGTPQCQSEGVQQMARQQHRKRMGLNEIDQVKIGKIRDSEKGTALKPKE